MATSLAGFIAETQAGVHARLMQRFSAIGSLMVQDLKHTLSTPYPPASEPGQPPHKRSGRLYDSIRWETAASPQPTLWVGTSAYRWERGGTPQTGGYPRFLEWGTSLMEKHPFMQPVVDRMDGTLSTFFGTRTTIRLGTSFGSAASHGGGLI